MRFAHRSFLVLLLPLFAAACNNVAYETFRDPEVDFARFQTFDWEAPPEPTTHETREKVLHEVIKAELVGKGLRFTAGAPDLLVAVNRTTEGQVHTRASGYEMRDGRIDRFQMQDGTLVIDLLVPGTNTVIWSCTASGVFRPDETMDERREFLTGVLAEMFADYPSNR